MRSFCTIFASTSWKIHPDIHTYIHKYIYIYTYIQTHTYIHTYILTYIHTTFYTYIHIYIHIYIRTHTVIHTNKQTDILWALLGDFGSVICSRPKCRVQWLRVLARLAVTMILSETLSCALVNIPQHWGYPTLFEKCVGFSKSPIEYPRPQTMWQKISTLNQVGD